MIPIQTCDLCGTRSRFHEIIGTPYDPDNPGTWDAVALCFPHPRADCCYKAVFTGKTPLRDGRWWAQVEHVDDDGTTKWVPTGPWVAKATWPKTTSKENN